MPQPITAVWPGSPAPRGAAWDGEGVNFSLFSEHAEAVDLCLFDPAGRQEVQRIRMPERTDQIWHCYLPEARPGLLYGYRVHGPYDPARGHRFNPNKLLLDPYTRALEGRLKWSDALMGYRIGSARGDLSFDSRDSAFAMPKSVVTDPAFSWGNDDPPRRLRAIAARVHARRRLPFLRRPRPHLLVHAGRMLAAAARHAPHR